MVGGGGGGKKVPPSGPPRPVSSPKAHVTGPQKPVSLEAPKALGDGIERSAGDSFDHFKSTNSDVHRGLDVNLEGAFAQAGSPSGIDNLVRLIEAARAQLAGENRVLRDQAQGVVEHLVAAGFAPSQLGLARLELAELRKRMAALRKRLKHLQRRLKTTFATAGKTGDAQFAKLLGAQLDRLRKLEPGMARALLALQTIEQAYGAFGDGSTPVLRLPVGDRGAPEPVGRALALLAPGAAIARATLALLRDGPAAKMQPRPQLDDVQDARLDGPRALVRALLTSGDGEA